MKRAKMQWQIVYEAPGTEHDEWDGGPGRLWVPEARTVREVSDAVTTILLRHKARKVTITEVNGGEAK